MVKKIKIRIVGMAAITAGVVGLCAFSLINSAYAAPAVPGCSSVQNVGGGVLWKPSNTHGGRGGSFLMGCQIHGSKWPTNKNPLPILDSNGTQIGRLGLWDPGHRPYGRRYYMKVSGGSYTEVNTLASRAFNNTGSRNVYVNGGSRGCFKLSDPRNREGSISPLLPVNGNAPC